VADLGLETNASDGGGSTAVRRGLVVVAALLLCFRFQHRLVGSEKSSVDGIGPHLRLEGSHHVRNRGCMRVVGIIN